MIYLDHAATSYPKPAAVLDAVQRWFRDIGVSEARGDSSRCRTAAQEVASARELLGDLVGLRGDRVAFCSGATEGLNLALRALLQPGDAVLTTAFEHSSVVRPLRVLERERSLRVHVLAPKPGGSLSLDDAATALATGRPRLFVFTHASNVTGTCTEAAALCELARQYDCRTLLDASQTAGLVDLRVGADVVVGSGHKALHGPPGIGFVAVNGLELPPQKQGGTGSSRALEEHPRAWPQAFEAGTPNTPGIFGLGAALRWVKEQEPARLLAHGLARVDELREGLKRKPGVRLLSPAAGPRVPILSFVHGGYDPAELGALFDSADIHVRTGFHCAPWLHAFLGTQKGGTVRLSPGPATTSEDVARVLAAFA
jgi:selenocysteine lyase/cysteine desulfurase